MIALSDKANVAFLAFRIAESLVEFLSCRTVAANMSGTTSVCILPASLGTILYLSKKSFDTFGAVDNSVLRAGLKLRGDNCFKSCCIFVVINEIVECVKFFVGFISELTKVSWPVINDVHELLCSSFAYHMFNGILEFHSFALNSRSEAGLEFRGVGIANESLDERLNEFRRSGVVLVGVHPHCGGHCVESENSSSFCESLHVVIAV